MGKTPVTLQQFNEFLAVTSKTSASATAAGPDQPVMNVEKKLAVQFCIWAAGPGNKGRLPSRDDASFAAVSQPALELGKQVWETMAGDNAVKAVGSGNMVTPRLIERVPPEELGFRCMADSPR
jgi:formylglycine-generating enzyme required for sulfatase activity